MSYEVEKPFEVHDEHGDFCFQCGTLDEAKAKFIDDTNDLDSVNKTLGHGDKSTISLVTHIAEFDITADDLYFLQPTAEWSRIQEQLKEHEWMKCCLVSMGVLCGESGDLCRFIGENNDTLQRIADEDTAVFPQAVGYSERLSMKEIEKLRSELQSLKSRLPTNRDGDGIAIGDNHFVADESTETGSAQWYVKGILMSEKDNSKFKVQIKSYRNGEVRTVDPEELHSTAESCKAAAAEVNDENA